MESRFARHLNEQFTPLNFPPELARRILTHGSHDKAANDGHNARLAFIGRRVMQTYTSLLLHSSPACDPSHDHEFIVGRTLNTYALGQYVAPHLQLARIVRWRPTVNPEISKRAQFKYTKDVPAHFEGGEEGKDIAREVDPELMVAIKSHPAVMRSVGLYKVMGEAVEALVGGTYHQFGGTVALRMFHTRVLPHLLLTGPLGLHPAYHADAFNKAQEMAKAGLVPVRAAAAQ
ncbi:hypothetical protein FIBSPDRAFT_913615 [Athelia psychrophila]|uniref:RNase III domain-containing protein n=1 Tax=Athelia psychrophila TaxID=1759441 RepID=A0A166AB76_9AGAM|nr:hypothetical protein FIBSPDRAFT_913615 [Fibularhizoctonia sp. CBS 109695]